jgi:PEGA domain
MVPLGPGRHTVRAESEGDVPEERTLEVVSGQAQAVTFSLRSLTRPVEVTLETKPVGALVSIDGEAGAPSPRKVMLKPGTHEMVARLEGHSSSRSDVVVQPGQPRSVTLELTSLPTAAPPARRFPVVGVSLLGVGLISAGVGAFFAVQANATANRVSSFAQPGGVTWDASWVKTERSGLQQQLAAQVLLGAGALTSSSRPTSNQME